VKTERSRRWAYFDTSALVKRYVDEPGRHDVLQLLGNRKCVTSAVHAVELRSALRRRVTERTVEAARIPQVLRHITADRTYWTQVDVSADVLAAAEALVATHLLRTLDAIHLASAQLFAMRMMMPQLLFVSADAHQTAAADSMGMTIRRIG
jgi:predicted nucleic acid-binding protein